MHNLFIVDISNHFLQALLRSYSFFILKENAPKVSNGRSHLRSLGTFFVSLGMFLRNHKWNVPREYVCYKVFSFPDKISLLGMFLGNEIVFKLRKVPKAERSKDVVEWKTWYQNGGYPLDIRQPYTIYFPLKEFLKRAISSPYHEKNMNKSVVHKSISITCRIPKLPHICSVIIANEL